MAVCSNARCFRPKPSYLGRCLTCNSLVTNTLVKQRYEIKQTIGRGGFGTTYLTKDRDRFNESCVLKELNLPSKDLFDSEFDNDLDTAERLFKREAQVLLNLQHPGIPKLHAYFHENNYSYLVQDFIPGFTLAEEVENNKRTFDEQEARTLLIELADILEYLHNKIPPIIHRDIKPQNLMRHARGKLLLIDFGAVCQAATPSKRTLIGSPGYSPPEQIAGQPVPQSDLYAAGATILRLLTGLHPSQLFNSKMRKFEWENSTQISPRFSALLKQLVAQDFLQRTPSATQLKDQLLELSDETPNKEAKAINLEPYELLTALHQERDTQDFQVTMESNPLLKDPQQFNTARLADEVGNLEPMSILHLLQRFYTQRFTGELICSKGLISKTIYFEDGSIIFEINPLLQINLMRVKKLRFGSALMEIGCITPAELRPFIVTQIANIIYSLFEWNSGQYGIKTSQPQAEAIKIPVSTADIIFEGLRRMENTDMIKTWLGDFTRNVISTDDPWMLYRVVNLQPKEAFIVSRLDSVMSIEEILSIGGLLETETLKTLCGLLAIGILQWADKNKPSYRDITIANVLIGPSVFPNTFDIHSATQFCYEVESLLKLISTSSYYEILSLSPDSNEEEIRDRYILLAKKFHPDRNIQLVNYNLNLNKELEKLFQYISEAYLTLSNRRSRTKYNNSLLKKSVTSPEDLNKSLANNQALQKPSSSTKETNKPPDDAPKPMAQSIAELPTLEVTLSPTLIVNIKDDSAGQTWLKKGLSYYNDGQYEHASRAFWAATMVEPNNAEFHSYLARCLAMLSGCADEAEKEFTKAIELSPDNADYYVQLGLFYQKINLLKESEKMFDKALMICPSHFVALRAKKS